MRIIEKGLSVGLSYERTLYVMEVGEIVQLWLYKIESEMAKYGSKRN